MKANPWKDQIAMYFLSIGAIEVDGEGHVWRLKEMRGGRYKWAWKNIEPKISEHKQGNGYLRAKFIINSRQYHVSAHRIVWLATKGIIPANLEINHKNGIKTDNRPGNLEVVTPSENMIHSHRILGRNVQKGEKHYNTKLTEKKVLEIRDYCDRRIITHRELGRIYDVSKACITLISMRRNWKHI